jgi:nanoRNase/pAp phosphatase (c-di-AMP/oligoRNAs hydrolase)
MRLGRLDRWSSALKFDSPDTITPDTMRFSTLAHCDASVTVVPAEVLAEMDVAAQACDRLADAGETLQFSLHPLTGRLDITLADLAGNPLAGVSPRAALDVAACGSLAGRLKFPARNDDHSAMPSAAHFSLHRTYRLVTRSDFDGLVCAALLKELGILNDILFVHPKDVQDGKVALTEHDITTNLPYSPEVALSFDHHSSEQLRVHGETHNRVMAADADSAARVVWNHFGGAASFPRIGEAMMEAVDRADAAKLLLTDILDPQGWILLSFLMDPRTGLGRFREFRISNYQLMMQLIDSCLELTIQEILASEDVAERVALYREHAAGAREQILRCATVRGQIVVLDLREEEVIHPANRFLLYALHPECTVSIHVMWGLRRQNTVFAIGRSILDRSSTVDIGALMLAHGGGGHKAAGTCQIDNDRAEATLTELVRTISSAGDAVAA